MLHGHTEQCTSRTGYPFVFCDAVVPHSRFRLHFPILRNSRSLMNRCQANPASLWRLMKCLNYQMVKRLTLLVKRLWKEIFFGFCFLLILLLFTLSLVWVLIFLLETSLYWHINVKTQRQPRRHVTMEDFASFKRQISLFVIWNIISMAVREGFFRCCLSEMRCRWLI